MGIIKDKILLGKGRVYFNKIKLPRSKKKRIVNKWIKRQSYEVEYFKIEIEPKERTDPYFVIKEGWGTDWKVGDEIKLEFKMNRAQVDEADFK